MSSDIPTDMSVSDRIKTKIWAHEYMDFGSLLNSKKEHASCHLCLSNYTTSSTSQPLITLEPNQKSKHINSIEMWDLVARGNDYWRYYLRTFDISARKRPKHYSWRSVHWELWIRSQPPRHTFSQMNLVKKIEVESNTVGSIIKASGVLNIIIIIPVHYVRKIIQW